LPRPGPGGHGKSILEKAAIGTNPALAFRGALGHILHAPGRGKRCPYRIPPFLESAIHDISKHTSDPRKRMSVNPDTPSPAAEARNHLESLSDPETADILQTFFKTGPGEYGEGDRFRGIRVPAIRKVAKEFREMPLFEMETLLESEFHEDRMLAVILMVERFRRAENQDRKHIYDRYLARSDRINNWDLVDVSTEHIVGGFLWTRTDRAVLDRLAQSHWMWDRRIAIVSTFHFIRRDHFEDTLRIAEAPLADPEDLLHKATGWMLREVGKRNLPALEAFLDRHFSDMPRTMLRYAIEKFPEPRRKAYLRR
jgi:3-methyladenine DNA glycosylase AlkD